MGEYLCRSISVLTFCLLHGCKTSAGEEIFGSPLFSEVSAFSQRREVPGSLPVASVHLILKCMHGCFY